MKRNLYGIQGIFGQTNYYDESGKKVGESWPGLFDDSSELYNKDGKHVGYTMPGVFADSLVYNDQGEKQAESWKGVVSDQNIYTDDGYIGSSIDTPFGTDISIDSDSFDF